MGSDRRTNSSSSGEEDGDADWRAAIESIVSTTVTPSNRSTVASIGNGSATNPVDSPSEKQADKKSSKLYQIKAQKLLDDILEKSIELVRQQPTNASEDHSMINGGGGIRLFRDAPPGIVFDRIDEIQRPMKRPRIVPGTEIDDKSKKFRHQIKSVAVDGHDIIASAKAAHQKSLAKLEARDAAAKAKAKREEERVAELKKIRGERWLPSIARQMQLKKH